VLEDVPLDARLCNEEPFPRPITLMSWTIPMSKVTGFPMAWPATPTP